MNKVIVKIGVLFALIAVLVVSLIIMNRGRKDVKCNRVVVTFSEDYQFVSPEQITNIVYNKVPRLKRGLLDTLNTDWLENQIGKHPWVKKAEVFKAYGLNDSLKLTGILNVHIEQEEPILRVMNGSSGFYLSEDGDKMPFSSHYTPKVIVVTGTISDKYLKTQVVDFVKFIDDDPFWKAQIEQIHIRKNNELVLVPRLGGHLILFGLAEKFELKFRNLMAVYQDGFSYGNWNKYKYVSLKFDNQVICTLR